MVASMVDKGAEVKPDELAPLRGLPREEPRASPRRRGQDDSPQHVHAVRHDLGRVRRQGGTRDDWNDILGAMLNEGAMLSEQDYPVLLAYLARNFKPQ